MNMVISRRNKHMNATEKEEINMKNKISAAKMLPSETEDPFWHSLQLFVCVCVCVYLKCIFRYHRHHITIVTNPPFMRLAPR